MTTETMNDATTTAATDLPTWDLSVYFESLDDPSYDDAFGEFKAGVDELEEQFDRLGVGEDASAGASVGVETVEDVVKRFNDLGDQARLLRSYVHGHITTDSRNERAQARMSELQPLMTRFGTLGTRMTAWMGVLPLDQLIAQSGVLSEHAFTLRKMKTEADRLMSPAEERLAAQLAETGGNAWAKLYGNFSSQIEVDLGDQRLPMSAVRNLAHDADAQVRRSAYEAELAAWKENELVIASAFNSIKGEASLLNRRRGWGGLLNESLFRANMDEDALNAMLSAARDAFPVFRRYLRAKASLLGHSGGLPWHDLFAPVGKRSTWTYGDAKAFIERHFRSYSDALGDFAARAFREQWVDAAPAPGKRDGAFCMPTRGDESRILMNFKPAFSAVATLAHELGHGYHNMCLTGCPPLQRQTPMTLAETASIFCETIVKRAALRETEADEQLAILEASLQGACQVVVDITSRFEFESSAVADRAARELSARELCEIMRQAQLNTYGNGLDENVLHPYMWAAKPHYYAWRSFYNFPYMFGLLFGLGLYAVYQNEPAGFHERYDALLGSTGLDDAASLGQRFGIDIRDKAFWAESLKVIERDVEKFEQLARRASSNA